jgi:zinc protease
MIGLGTGWLLLALAASAAAELTPLTTAADRVPAGVPALVAAELPVPVADTLVASPPVGRDAIEALTFPPVDFHPPRAEEHELLGVPVYHLYDPTLPLVDVFVQLRGGISHFPREDGPALTALTSLLRTGGTRSLPPDSVDARLDLLALQLSMGSGGGGTFAALNSLTGTLDPGLELLGEILLRPAFDTEAVEVWRGQELERIRRREDDPGSLAFGEFNRLMFGDHPVGWVFTEEEVRAPPPGSPGTDPLDRARLERLHGRIHCRENLILGVAGDLTWADAEPRVRAFLEAWPTCPEPLATPPLPELRRERAVFVLPRPVEQTTVVLAGPGGLRQEDSPEFFASRLADFILGSGGFTSRIFSRVRTERGLAYGASSLWTTPVRYEGLVGVVTATRPERTLEAVELVLEILEDFREDAPSREEVELALEQIVNGYVFAFESASQIVARRMGDRAQGLADGWLERYLEGIQAVEPGDILEVARRYIRPEEMTLLLVGDADRFGPGLEAFGPVYRLHPDGSWEPWAEAADPVPPPDSAGGGVDGGDPEGDKLPPHR